MARRDWGGGGKIFQLSVKGMAVQADGNSWTEGRAKHITSRSYSTKHILSPDRPGNHRLHTADKKREIPRNKMTFWFHLLIIMFVFIASLPKPNLRKRSRAPHSGTLVCWRDDPRLGRFPAAKRLNLGIREPFIGCVTSSSYSKAMTFVLACVKPAKRQATVEFGIKLAHCNGLVSLWQERGPAWVPLSLQNHQNSRSWPPAHRS